MNRLLLAGLLLAAPAVAVEAPPSLTYSRTISSAVAIPATAAASPLNLKQLRALYADIVKPIEPTRLWFKKPLAARLGAERDAEVLVQRIEKTFGDAPDSPAAPCRSAAIQQRMYVGAMNNMVALAEGHGQPAADAAPIRQTRAWLVWLAGAMRQAARDGLDMNEVLARPLPPEFARLPLAASEYRRSVGHLFPAAEQAVLEEGAR